MTLTPCTHFARQDWSIYNILTSLEIEPETTVEEFEAKMSQLLEANPAAMAAFSYDALSAIGGHTLLHTAAQRGNVALINYFVREGGQALLEIGDSMGNTPLHRTVEKGHYHATQALLRIGANPNIFKRKRGQALNDRLSNPDTALMVALREQFPDRFTVKQLVKHGAQLHPWECLNLSKARLLQQVKDEVAAPRALTFCWEQLGLEHDSEDATASVPSDQFQLDALPGALVREVVHQM